MKEKNYKASFTIETTYISVFIYLSILLIIYLTLSIYNVSVLTSNAYLILLEKSECVTNDNESIENDIFEEACETLKGKIVSVESLHVETKTDFKKLSIIYNFITKVPIENRLSKVFNKSPWKYTIEVDTFRVRIEESLRLMKAIQGGIEE